MTRDEFIQSIKDTNEPTEWFLENFVVLPCSCDYEECKGWKVIPIDALKIVHKHGGSKMVRECFGIDWEPKDGHEQDKVGG